MRVFLPVTVSGLRRALEAGSVKVDVGYAVTPALREWYAAGDQEELEYVAGQAAARASLRQLADARDEPRRIVLAAEVPDGDVRPERGGRDRAAVGLTGPVPLRLVESALVDDADAADDVRRAAAALDAADAGDDDAAFTVGAVEDHELGWWAVQELPSLIAPES